MCVNANLFGGTFLQGVFNLDIGQTLNLRQVQQNVTMLQSLSALQQLNCARCAPLFDVVQSAITQIAGMGFNGPFADSAAALITGLQSIPGYDNGLFGFLQTPDLTELMTSNGQLFFAGLQDLLGTRYAAHSNGLAYLGDAFEFLGYALSSSDGVDISTTLEFPPSNPGSLRNFGFLAPIISQYGDNVGLEGMLNNARRLLAELKGQAFIFHLGDIHTDADLDTFNTLISQMNDAGLLLDPTVTGFQGVTSMTNMLEILSTFAR